MNRDGRTWSTLFTTVTNLVTIYPLILLLMVPLVLAVLLQLALQLPGCERVCPTLVCSNQLQPDRQSKDRLSYEPRRKSRCARYKRRSF